MCWPEDGDGKNNQTGVLESTPVFHKHPLLRIGCILCLLRLPPQAYELIRENENPHPSFRTF